MLNVYRMEIDDGVRFWIAANDRDEALRVLREKCGNYDAGDGYTVEVVAMSEDEARVRMVTSFDGDGEAESLWSIAQACRHPDVIASTEE